MKRSLVFILLLSLAGGGAAFADGGAEELIRLMDAGAESPAGVSAGRAGAGGGIIRITPDKTHIMRIDRPAASVVVTNPVHAEVLLDTPQTLVILPRRPGTTSFTVLDAAGTPFLRRTVIVDTGAQPSYVRIRRNCMAQDTACATQSYYYCPDGCYEVQAVQPGQTQVPPVAGAPAAAAPQMTPAPGDGTAGEEEER